MTSKMTLIASALLASGIFLSANDGQARQSRFRWGGHHSGSSAGQTQRPHNCGGTCRICNPPTSVPELNASGAATAIAIIAGFGLVAMDRRRRLANPTSA